MLWEFDIIVYGPDGQVYRQKGDIKADRGWWAAIQRFRKLSQAVMRDMENCEHGKLDGTYSPPDCNQRVKDA